uniref:Ubiquinol-cytochrome C reductase hinge domain-containing protein n=1 Tax=Glossina palpalis gambiensis TaxID=67801 RepID=A0A1B0AMG1_9MUSC
MDFFPIIIRKWFAILQVHADDIKEKEELPKKKLRDPMKELREECSSEKDIFKLYDILIKCNDDVDSKAKTQESCEEQLFNFLQNRDDYLYKSLFDHSQ